MTQYAPWIDPTMTKTKILQASDAPTLEKLVNNYIATIDGTKNVITAITLAGAGDGFTFVVLVETAAVVGIGGSDLETGAGGGLIPGLTIPLVGTFQLTTVRCYLAGTADALSALKASLVPPVINVQGAMATSVVVDQQVAGAAKGARFMGLNVYTAGTIPTDVLAVSALWPLLPVNGLVANTILSFDAAPTTNSNFSLPVPNAIRYDGAGSFTGRFDATIAVRLTAGAVPSLFTAEFLAEPLVSPSAFGTMTAGIDAVGGSETFSLLSIRAVTGGVTPQATFGMRLNVPAATTLDVLGGFIRIVP